MFKLIFFVGEQCYNKRIPDQEFNYVFWLETFELGCVGGGRPLILESAKVQIFWLKEPRLTWFGLELGYNQTEITWFFKIVYDSGGLGRQDR